MARPSSRAPARHGAPQAAARMPPGPAAAGVPDQVS